MAFTEKERLFVDLLKEAGDKLVHPPSNVDEILSLLDVVECCLLRISEPPSKSFENALGPLTMALLAEDLMRHSDNDVKVSLASCISELTRLSAPGIPYDDEQLTRAFRLIVDALDGLSDTSSRSYSKRVSILESMAKVPSYVVLLGHRYRDMILEMFQHFLKSKRDDHPDHVFSAMETIMTLVLTESDAVPGDLFLLLLDITEKDFLEDVLPIGRHLAGNVIRNYNAINKSKSLEKAGADRILLEANKVPLEVPGSGLVDLALGRSYKSVVTNDDTQTGDSLTYPSFPQKKPQCTDHNTDEAKTTDTVEKIEPDNLESKMVVKPETEPGQAIKKTREVQNLPERSFDNSDNRDAALEAEHRFTLIEPCERREKTIATYKSDKNLYAVESWENSKKAALEAKLKKIEDPMERKKAEYMEEKKNEVALIHNKAEEKSAMIETAGKNRVSGFEKRAMRIIIPIILCVAVGAYLLFLFFLMVLWNHYSN